MTDRNPHSVRLSADEDRALRPLAEGLRISMGKLLKSAAFVLAGTAKNNTHSCYRVWIDGTTILGLGDAPPAGPSGDLRQDLCAVDLVGPDWFWKRLRAEIGEESS